MLSALLGLSWSSSSFKAKSSFTQLSWNCQSSNTLLKDYSKSSNPSIPSGSSPLPGGWFLLTFINSPAGMMLPHAFAVGVTQSQHKAWQQRWPAALAAACVALSSPQGWCRICSALGAAQGGIALSFPGWCVTLAGHVTFSPHTNPSPGCHSLCGLGRACPLLSSLALLAQGGYQPVPGKLLKCSFILGNLRDYMLQGQAHCGVNSQQNHSPAPGNAEDWCYPSLCTWGLCFVLSRDHL